jgi:hypothetical protein
MVNPQSAHFKAKMYTSAVVSVLAAATAVVAQQPDEDGRYTISAPGIKAQVYKP